MAEGLGFVRAILVSSGIAVVCSLLGTWFAIGLVHPALVRPADQGRRSGDPPRHLIRSRLIVPEGASAPMQEPSTRTSTRASNCATARAIHFTQAPGPIRDPEDSAPDLWVVTREDTHISA
jgi:hypothetical protein